MPKIAEAVREERRDAILQAAVDSLAEHGYTGTTMRTIAAAAGLTKGGLYAYFESKEAILLEVARRHMEHRLADYAPRPGESATAQLLRFFRRWEPVPGLADAGRVARAIMDLWAFGGALPAVRGALADRYTRFQAAVADLIRRGQTEGEFRPDLDAEQVAALILAARDGIAYHALSLGLPVDAQALDARFYELLRPYLKK